MCSWGEQPRLIGRRFDQDDALFLLPGGRVAEVHLTWSGKREPDPGWPSTAIWPSLEAWAKASMRADHDEAAGSAEGDG